MSMAEAPIEHMPCEIISEIVSYVPYDLWLPLRFVKLFAAHVTRREDVQQGPFFRFKPQYPQRYAVEQCGKVAATQPLLCWLHDELHMPWTASIFEGAARGNDVELCRWLRDDIRCPIVEQQHYNNIACSAIAKRHHAMLRWLLHAGICRADRYMEYAACMYNFRALKLLYSWGGELGTQLCISATSVGNLEMVQWIHEVSRCPLKDGWTSVAAQAAIGGWVHILQWLVENDNSLASINWHSEYVSALVREWARSRGFLE